jgi:serine kinase of HPr protein (carbohydrate metabolism regulator)
MIRHAGLLALRRDGLWCGALVEGPSGVGKSDLALRAIAAGFRLVADDRTLVFASGGRLYGKAPESLRDRIEVRGQGIITLPSVPLCRIDLIVRCVSAVSAVERMPETRLERLAGLDVPVFDLWPLEPAAPVKLRHMLEHLGVAL